MSRRPLLDLLARYAAAHRDELARVARFESLLREEPDCFLRSGLPGHLTASAFVLSPNRKAVLLTHHRKLDRWLQLGGHADGDTDLRRVALREVCEESGLTRLGWPSPAGDAALPLDLDIHPIPARDPEPAHLHYDVRWLLMAAPGQPIRVSEESRSLRWVSRETLATFVPDESVLRLERKARAILPPDASQEMEVTWCDAE